MSDERARAGLYVHVPFCSFVCPYCDFAVTRLRPGVEEGYLADLLREAELRGDWETPFDTLYLGGGTPSILGADRLARLIAGLRRRLPLAEEAVIHMEANPEDLDRESLAAFRDLGVSFLSIGLQSLDDRELRFLGRRHDAADGRRALDAAIAAGFPVVSVDLIFGLPDQDPAVWRRNLEQATPAGVAHVSCYQLTLKPGTLFAKRRELGRLDEAGDDEQGDFHALTHETLALRGFTAYEVSNFARGPESRSRHNMKYWAHAPYLGLGPGAHSFAGEERFWNPAAEAAWRAELREGRLPEEGRERLGPAELADEALLLGLRRPEGIDLAEIERRHGYRPGPREEARIAAFAAAGLLVAEGRRLRPTVAGLAVADSMAADLACASR